LPSVFAAKFELLVHKKKKFWRRGGHGRRWLCVDMIDARDIKMIAIPKRYRFVSCVPRLSS
jgi:hypothetical protein